MRSLPGNPTRTVLPLVLAAACLTGLSACSSATMQSGDSVSDSAVGPANQAMGGEEAGGMAADAAPRQGESNDGPAAGAGSATAEATRHIAKTGLVQIEADHEQAMAAARTIIKDAGGTVLIDREGPSKNGYGPLEDQPELTRNFDAQVFFDHEVTGLLVVSVNPNTLDDTMAALGDLGTVISQQQTATDITAEVVDVDARVAAQEASITRLRELQEKANSLADLIEVERELTNRIAELDALKARQKALKDRTDASTLAVAFYEPGTHDPTQTSRSWAERAGARITDTLKSAVAALGFFGLALLWLAIVLAPLALIALVAWRRVKHRRAARRAHQAATQPAGYGVVAADGTPQPEDTETTDKPTD